MTLPVSGPISLNNVNVELGLSGTTSINMNQASVRTLFAVPSGAISMSNGYGKSNRVTAAATISSDTANYTVNTAKASGYVAGVTDFTLTINNGVTVFSNSTGSYAMTVDTSWSAGDTVTIVNNGTIVGRGGDGGPGGTGVYGGGSSGGGGGPALLVQRAITMNNLNRIAGGGGGGGGRNGTFYQSDEAPGGCGDYYAGGSGGGGIGGSSGGGVTQDFWANARRNTGGAGGAGSLTSAGGGSSRNGQTGGSGGGYGSAGSAGSGSEGGPGGGAGGVCIQGNSNITYTNTGTRNGTING
jgi:hypothetical protein